MQKLLLSFAVVFIGSFAVAATIFLKQGPLTPTNAQAAQPTVASCQKGFDRPLIFGVGSTNFPGGYGPVNETEGGLIRAGSTLATVPLNWDTIQKDGPADYNPESVNFPIRKAVQTGRVVVVNLSGTPRWASGNKELEGNDKYEAKAQPDKASDLVNREFRELVQQAVRDNKDKVKYWTYWNEPNGCMSSRGDCGYNGDSLEDFAYWHHVFYETVKEVDPSAKIIFANIDLTDPKNIAFVRDALKLTDEFKVEYDYLGVNAYDKKKNAKLPIDWIKAAYDAQGNYKKPIWLNEWGFDRQWWNCGNDDACKTQARLDMVPLIKDGLDKIRDNNWIYAAQYHHLIDDGGDYGLWDRNFTPRPGGTEFLKLVNERCNPTFSNGGTVTPPPTEAGACVVASHDLGNDFLKRGQTITLTSVASKPVKTFRYAFYNSDNKKSNGIANMYCVTGAKEVAGDDCPDGSGQLVKEVNGDNNFEGAVQAAAWLRVPNGSVIDSVWRGDIGWNRTLPYGERFGQVSGIGWNLSGYLGIENFGVFRSTAEIDALDFYTADNKTGYMEIWRNNIGKRTEFSFNAAGDYPNWATSKISDIANLNNPNDASSKAFPGTDVITAAGSFVTSNKLYQIHWRGNAEWMRTVPIANGKPDFSKATAYTQTRTNSSLPTPNTKVQAINFMVMPDNRVQEQIWLNNQMYLRFIPRTNGEVDFTKAGAYDEGPPTTNTTPNSNLTDSLTLSYNDVRVVDTLTGKIPENVQINATFVTEGGTIRDDGKCVMRFAHAKSIPGDVDGNCMNDIYDYNLLLQHYGTDNCMYNLTGTGCTIDAADVKVLTDNFGNKCES